MRILATAKNVSVAALTGRISRNVRDNRGAVVMGIARVSFLVISILFLGMVEEVGAVDISSCTNITSSGTYTLTQDITQLTDTCMRIQANNVIFDGQGYTLTGPNSSYYYGIIANSIGNITVKNVTVDMWNIGIVYGETGGASYILNTTAKNSGEGIHLGISSFGGSTNSTVINNSIINNSNVGIDISGKDQSGENIYNNFLNNTNNFIAGGLLLNNWNTSKQAGINIVGGPYLGGNFWAHPNGTGFSETCIDADGDGICDSNYTMDSYNIDYLPLAAFQVTINNPVNDTISSDAFNFSFNREVDTARYSIDSGANTSNTTLNQTWPGTLSGLSDGQHNITVWANDTSGNTDTATRYWTRSVPSGGGRIGLPIINPSPPPPGPELPIVIPEPPFEELPEDIICQVLLNITSKKPFQDYLTAASKELIRELYLAKIITYSEAVNSLYFNYGYSTRIGMIQVGWWYIQRTIGIKSKVTIREYNESTQEPDFTIPITYGSSLECWLPETISTSGITVISQDLNLTVDDLRARYMAGLITYTQSVNSLIDYNEYSFPLAMITGFGWVIGKHIGITDRRADVLGIIAIFIFVIIIILALMKIPKKEVSNSTKRDTRRGWFGEGKRHRRAYYKGRKK